MSDPNAPASGNTSGTASSTPTADAAGPITVTHHGDIRVVEFSQNKVLDEANISEIGARVGDLVQASSKPRLLFDFAKVEHLSSAALGMLISANNDIRKRNGEMRLCTIRPQILEVFKITKLDQLFKIYEDRKTALNSFGMQKTDV